MSRYDHDYYDSNDCNCGGKRKASATAKTALGLAIVVCPLLLRMVVFWVVITDAIAPVITVVYLAISSEIVAILAIAKRNMNKVLVL